jgi:ABC-type sulfate transport system permease component
VLDELRLWAQILEKARSSADQAIDNAVQTALEARGLGEASAALTVATVSRMKTAPVVVLLQVSENHIEMMHKRCLP